MEIIQGDSETVLKSLADESFDAVVTDPPFGIGKTYGDKKELASNAETYWAWLEPIYRDMLRVLKPGGFAAIWQSQVYFKHFWEWFDDDIHIYCAAKNFVQLRKTPINSAYDPVVMFYKDGTPLRPQKPKRNVDFFVANTAAVVSNPDRIEHAHPYPRPLDQVTEILNNFVVDGGLILDPFLGSGTTALAAKNTGRRCVGIELEAEYVELAQKRLNIDSIDQKF